MLTVPIGFGARPSKLFRASERSAFVSSSPSLELAGTGITQVANRRLVEGNAVAIVFHSEHELVAVRTQCPEERSSPGAEARHLLPGVSLSTLVLFWFRSRGLTPEFNHQLDAPIEIAPVRLDLTRDVFSRCVVIEVSNEVETVALGLRSESMRRPAEVKMDASECTHGHYGLHPQAERTRPQMFLVLPEKFFDTVAAFRSVVSVSHVNDEPSVEPAEKIGSVAFRNFLPVMLEAFRRHIAAWQRDVLRNEFVQNARLELFQRF